MFLLICGGISVISSLATGVVICVLAQTPLSIQDIGVMLSAAAIVLVFSLWVAYASVQPLRRRLYDLEEGASLIASGRLYHRVPTMGDSDEIGRVTDQFNQMGEQIEQQVHVLQKLAEENRQLAAEAEQAASLSERQRLARELHDSVSQQLFAITMLAGSAERQFGDSSPKLPQTLKQLSDLANAAQREMRALLLHLRPVELEGRTLQTAAEAFLSAVEERHQLVCELDYKLSGELGAHIEEQVFRILQEAVANVLKHAEATQLQVEIAMNQRLLHVVVLDDGKGIDDTTNSKGGSYGIRAMRERASALGGQCNIFRRDKGTAVEVRIPVFSGKEGNASD